MGSSKCRRMRFALPSDDVTLGFTRRAAVCPLGEFVDELLMREWGHGSTHTRIPSPVDEVVRSHVLQQRGQVSVAVLRWILESAAQLPSAEPFPGHRGLRVWHPPIGNAWRCVGELGIGGLVAVSAPHCQRPAAVLAALDIHVVLPALIALKRRFHGDVTIQAARTGEYRSDFAKCG